MATKEQACRAPSRLPCHPDRRRQVWRPEQQHYVRERITADIEVEGSYIPRQEPHGLTVTYCVFGILEHKGPRDRNVTMMTCVDGQVKDSVDVAGR